MQTITKYLADDGREFLNSDECLEYEKDEKEIKAINAMLPEYPADTCAFVNGGGYIIHEEETFNKARLLLLAKAKKYAKEEYDIRDIIHAENHNRRMNWPYERIKQLACPVSLINASHRIYCVDDQFREWGQPFYAFNPDRAEHKQLNKKKECDYEGCDNEATLWDSSDGEICEDCMEREIRDSDVTEDDFEPLKMK